MTSPLSQINGMHLLELLDSISDSIIVKDVAGHWLYANQAIVDWFQLEHTICIGRTSKEIADNAETYRRYFAEFDTTDETTWENGRHTFEHNFYEDGKLIRSVHVQKWIANLGTGFEQVLITLGRDVTELKQTEASRSENELKFRTLFDHAGDALFIARFSVDNHFQLVEVNDVACFHLGYTRDELLTKTPLDVIDPDFIPTFETQFMNRLLANGRVTLELAHITKTGQKIPVEISSRLIAIRDEHYTFTIVRDISERKAYELLLYEKAYFDDVTGLPNGRWMLEQSRIAQLDLHPAGDSAGILVVNLDNLRQIHDTYGRQVGDELIQIATARIAKLLPPTAQMCRWSSEDWVISSTGIEHCEEIRKLGNEMQSILRDAFKIGCSTIFLSARIGIRCYPMHAEELPTTVDSLVRQASLVAHESEKQDLERVVEYSIEIESGAARRLDIVDGLRYALTRGELYLVYQPKWNAAKNVIGMEALVRWKHPDWGIVSPAAFIPVAEETGLIVELGDFVMQQACAQLRAWREAGYPILRVAVNVSVRQLEQANFFNRFQDILRENTVAPHQIELEVTESIMMQSKQAFSILEALHDYGVCLAIDDFGTGYSSLSYLNKLPIHTLKIDRSFVQRLERDDSTMITGIIQLAHSFGLDVVAEGVETGAQLEILRDHQCDAYQGYLVGRPIDANEFANIYLRPPN